MAASQEFSETSVLAGYESSNTRLWLALIGLLVVFAFIITLLVVHIRTLDAKNAALANNRIMYAFPNEDGTLVSSRRRPQSMVRRFARDFISNRYNYDPLSVHRNFEAAAKMIAPGQAVAVARSLRKLEGRVAKNQLSEQLTILRAHDLIEHKGSYAFVIVGRLTKFVGTTFASRKKVTIKVTMAKVTPTESRRTGLWVSGVQKGPL